MEQPLDRVGQVLLGRACVCRGEVSVYVGDGAFEDVELVVEVVEFLAGDDELGFAEAGFGRSLAGFVVALAARLAAVLPRTACGRRDGQSSAAPPAPLTLGGFRH